MADSHYVRTLGPDGGVDPCEGPAIGLEISALLADGIPPWNVALEIVAGLAEILVICEEDDVYHGAIEPACVFVDETGAVSLEGHGTRNAAPEGGRPNAKGDCFGLGGVLSALIGSPAVPAGLDKEAHEDAVVDLVLGVDLEGLPAAMQGDLQWFLGRLLDHAPRQRPPAIDVWRTLLAFARSVEGPDIVTWCDLALDGGGERRKVTAPADLPRVEDAAADGLDDARRSTGPLAAPMVFETTDSSGPGTGMFTRAQLRDGLKAAEAPLGVGGGGATGHWSQDELKAMREGGKGPAPARGDGEVARKRTMAVPKPVRAPHSQRRATPMPPPEVQRPPPPPPPPLPEPDLSSPVEMAPPAPPAPSSGLWMFAAVALLSMALGFACAGLLAAGGVAFLALG